MAGFPFAGGQEKRVPFSSEECKYGLHQVSVKRSYLSMPCHTSTGL